MPVLTSGDQLTMDVPYPFVPETTRLPGKLPPVQTLLRLSELATVAALTQLTPGEGPLPVLPQLKEGEKGEKRTDFDDIQWNERDGTLPKREPNKSGINKGDSEKETGNGNGDKE